jgi:hypothetical protein
MTARLPVLLLAAASLAFGCDREFDALVKQIQSHYGTAPTHIPFMGLANLFIKSARPEGVSGFRLAVFENLPPSTGDDDFMSTLKFGGLHPMVQVRSRRDGEATYIFAGDIGKSTELFIATFERNEATVIQVRANMKTLANALKDPEHMGAALGANRHDDDK